LAFHGQPAEAAPAEHPEEEEPAAQRAASHAAPSHGARPHDAPAHRRVHDAPPPMAIALLVLAVGSVFAGYAGLGNRFERFLAPSFGAGEAARAPGEGDAAAQESASGRELALMVVSSAVAVGGIGLAFYLF